MKYPLLIAVALLLPQAASAAVMVNEVAWMGSLDSPNHEWIELYNGGTVIDVTGWRLSDGNNLDIELVGSIAAGEYVVLERTSDASAPGTAWLVYTGALVNTGSTLTLYDSSGQRVDVVAGGENWETIGGDNTEKFTAQRTVTGWVTAEATPGEANASRSAPPVLTNTTTETTVTKQTSGSTATARGTVSSRSSTPPLTLTLPDLELTLDVVAPVEGYLNQPVELSIKATGLGKTWLNSLTFDWNFGDGRTTSGKTVRHQFSHPGTYIVTVVGSYKQYTAVTRHEITILPMKVSLSRSSSDQLLLNNDSPYDIDISGHTVTSGTESFTFPPHSYVAARQTIPVPKVAGSFATALDNEGFVIAREVSPATGSFALVTSELPFMQAVVREVPAPPPRIAVVNKELEPASVLVAQAEDVTTPGYFGFAMRATTTATTTSRPLDVLLATETATIIATSAATITVSAPASPATESAQRAGLATANTPANLRDWWLSTLIVLLVISIFAIYTRPSGQ